VQELTTTELDSNAYDVKTKDTIGWAHHTIDFYKRKPAGQCQWTAYMSRLTGRECFAKGEGGARSYQFDLDDDYELQDFRNKEFKGRLIDAAKAGVEQILEDADGKGMSAEEPTEVGEQEMRRDCIRLYTMLRQGHHDGTQFFTKSAVGGLTPSYRPMGQMITNNERGFLTPVFSMAQKTPTKRDPRNAKRAKPGAEAETAESWRLVIKYHSMVSDASQVQMLNIILQSAVGEAMLDDDRTRRFAISRRRGKGNEAGEGEIERVAFDRGSEGLFQTHTEGKEKVAFQRGFKLDIKPCLGGHVVVPDTKVRAVNVNSVLDKILEWNKGARDNSVDPYGVIMKELNPKFRADGACLYVIHSHSF
jgi:hypothetical protein